MSRNKEIHTRMNNTIFPISAEYFCEIQERLTGNTTTAGMRRVFEAIVPVINEVFEKGKRGEVWKPATPKEIGKAVKSISRPANVDFMTRLGTAMEEWCKLAYEKGRSGENA